MSSLLIRFIVKNDNSYDRNYYNLFDTVDNFIKEQWEIDSGILLLGTVYADNPDKPSCNIKNNSK